MDTATVQQASSIRHESNYITVPVDTLKCLTVAPVDVFVAYKSSGPPMLYCRAGYPLASVQFLGLSDAGVEKVFVRTEDFHSFGEELLESVQSLLLKDDVPAQDRFALLQAAISVEIENSARLVDCRKFLSLADKVGRDLVSLLANSDVLPQELFGMARHDFFTFTHVTNVASYCIVLAERLGIRNEVDLNQIATAAILHDLGKRFVSASILTKPARLDAAERAIIELHPVRGYEELQNRSEYSFGQLMMVYQHHERVDGTGYPVGIMGGDMHPWAKMIAVVDVFDAMTGKRPYRRPASLSFVLDYIRQNSGTHFDTEAAQCWMSAMSET
jgi:HD-GYP domain-containing protein (c-di-GMP phosphodiesterase class II)